MRNHKKCQVREADKDALLRRAAGGYRRPSLISKDAEQQRLAMALVLATTEPGEIDEDVYGEMIEFIRVEYLKRVALIE